MEGAGFLFPLAFQILIQHRSVFTSKVNACRAIHTEAILKDTEMHVQHVEAATRRAQQEAAHIRIGKCEGNPQFGTIIATLTVPLYRFLCYQP